MKITEFKKYETRHILLESLDKDSRNTYLIWEGVGQQLKEAALSPQQIQGLFGEIEKSATAAGGNRTAVGAGLDKINQVVMKPYNDLKAKIYNSGPMQGFAEKYDQAAEALKQKAGGDEGRVMQVVNKYRRFAEKHPIMQGFIYAALIAAAGISGAGLGGAAALGLFKLTDQLLQGKDIRSAIFQATKTGALAAGASTVGDLIRGGEAAADVQTDVTTEPTTQARQGAFTGGGSSIDGRTFPDVNVNVSNIIGDYTPGDTLTSDQMNAILDLDSTEGLPQNVIDQYNSQLDAHVASMDAGGTTDVTATDTTDVDVTAKVEPLENPARGDVQTAASQEALVQDGDVIDRRLSKGGRVIYTDTANSTPGRPAQYTITVNDDGDYVKTYTRPMGRRAESIINTNANLLTEDQVMKLFMACAYRQNLMEAPKLFTNLKKQIGKGVTALGQKARQVGTNITTKITADKLMKAWNKAGKPTDSVQIAQFLQSQGIDGAIMQQAFQTAGIKMPDLKKIASDDPVVSLAQQINANPAIKKQVLKYLNAVT